MKINIILYNYFISLIFLGSIFVYSSSTFISYFFYQNTFYFYKKQFIGILLSILIIFITSKIKNIIYKKHFYILYICCIICNTLLFIPFFSCQINGAKRWINFFGLIFQPSELLKFNYILSTAHILDSLYDQTKHSLFCISINFIIHTALLIMQSDFGALILLGTTTICLLWNYLYHKKIFFYIFFFAIVFITPLLYFFPYRIARISIFIDPWKDTFGKGFQIIQSLIAIHNGGICGNGIGSSIQKRLFLPMPHTDFILSIIGEETGLFGVLFILAALFAFSYIIIYFGNKSKFIWEKQYCLGTGILLIMQTIINSGATVSLLPTKGMGLPLISYGISSLIGYSILIGIAINIIKNNT